MRFKISKQGPTRHTKVVTCVAWIASDEFFSCGDDHTMISWKFEGGTINSKVVVEFPEDFYPTHMEWHPRPAQSAMNAVKKSTLDVLLITTDDGKFHLVSRSGRIEKSVSAHDGATLCGKWSSDGTALFTVGEDGLVKIWSRSGMLRSTAIRGNQPIFSAAWSPDSSAVLYSQGPHLLVQSLTTSSKPHKWLAHEGLILAVAWNQFHGLIISGGEDCRHKVWDSKGTPLYASASGDHPITSVNWCFAGDYFAVGSYNTLKLCDRTGWPHSLEKLQAGSVYDVAWSSDGTQVALACSSGSVLVAHTIQRKLEYNSYEATLVKRKAIQVTEVGTDVNETLEISDRVIQLEFGFDHLIAVTPSQCHIFSVTNWNTPAIFDLKNGSVSAVLLADKHFLLVEWCMLSLYNYQGRSLGSPKWKGMTSDPLYAPCISLCSDTLVVRDQTNHKLLHVMEISQKKPITEAQAYNHYQDVISLAMNYVGEVTDRQLALIDVNRDLYLVSIRSVGFPRVCKIAAMVQNIAWAIDANVLAGILDATLSVWLCPNCVHYSDRKIIRKTRVDRKISELGFGKHPTIVKAQNGIVTVRRGDGALVVLSLYTFFGSLHRHVLNGRWEEAVSLCRIVQTDTLWTCMAVMAIDSKQLNIAEEACAAIDRFDKVDYIRYIKKLPNELERLAEISLLAGDLLAAEGILLQNGLASEAIRINTEMYNWSRALELSIKHKKMLSEVLEARKHYLETLGKKEVNQSFLAVQANIAKAHSVKKEAREAEKDKEREREKDIERDENGYGREEVTEIQRERDIEKQRERDNDKQREKEMERQREKEMERQQREIEKRRERELEKQREKELEEQRELELQREEEIERQRERELLRQREREMRKQREKEERLKEREKESQREREVEKQRKSENQKQRVKEGEKPRRSVDQKQGDKEVKKPREKLTDKPREKVVEKPSSRAKIVEKPKEKDAPKLRQRVKETEKKPLMNGDVEKKKIKRREPEKPVTKTRKTVTK